MTTAQNRPGAARTPSRTETARNVDIVQHAQSSTAQPSLFGEVDTAPIVAAIAARFSCYGIGTPPNARNAIAVTLAGQPPQFAFGVHVADVVRVVLELAGVPFTFTTPQE